MLLRADSIFGPTVLAEESTNDLYLRKHESSGTDSGRISISKPALVRMGTMLNDLEKQVAAGTEKEQLGPHSMSLRQGRNNEFKTDLSIDSTLFEN